MTAAVRLVATMGYWLGWQPSCSDMCRGQVTELQSSARTQLRTRAQMVLRVWLREIELSVSQDIIHADEGALAYT